jgi:hypothetical protein
VLLAFGMKGKLHGLRESSVDYSRMGVSKCRGVVANTKVTPFSPQDARAYCD